MLHHHIAGGQEPELSSLDFVWLRAENLIVQQHVISLKQIWKMLPKDKMISRPWNFVQRKWRICFKIKTVSVTRNWRHWDKIQVNKFNSKTFKKLGLHPNQARQACRTVRETRIQFLEPKSFLSSFSSDTHTEECITYNILFKEGILPGEVELQLPNTKMIEVLRVKLSLDFAACHVTTKFEYVILSLLTFFPLFEKVWIFFY